MFVPFCRGGKSEKLLKRVKFLEGKGVASIVVTVNNPTKQKDEALLKDLPKSLRIYRTNYFLRSIRFLYNSLGGGNYSIGSIKDESDSFKERFKKVLYKLFIVSKYWVFFPDAWISWLPFAVVKGIKVVKEEKLDLLWTDCYPFTTHLIGYAIKKLTKISWVVEYGDPWITNPMFIQNRFLLKLHSKLEYLVVRNADKVLFARGCQIERDYFSKTYPDELESKFVYMPYYGYDACDFSGVKYEKGNRRLTI